MSTTYTIQQNGEPIENGDFASLEEARQGMAALETELGWRNLRIVRSTGGPRTNLSGRILTGDDAHDVVAVGAEAAPPIEAVGYVTWGDVRGYGTLRMTRDMAEQDLARDQEGCQSQGGYSDRMVFAVDANGWLRTESGDHVWPSSGRSHGAERVVLDT